MSSTALCRIWLPQLKWSPRWCSGRYFGTGLPCLHGREPSASMGFSILNAVLPSSRIPLQGRGSSYSIISIPSPEPEGLIISIHLFTSFPPSACRTRHAFRRSRNRTGRPLRVVVTSYQHMLASRSARVLTHGCLHLNQLIAFPDSNSGKGHPYRDSDGIYRPCR